MILELRKMSSRHDKCKKFDVIKRLFFIRTKMTVAATETLTRHPPCLRARPVFLRRYPTRWNRPPPAVQDRSRLRVSRHRRLARRRIFKSFYRLIRFQIYRLRHLKKALNERLTQYFFCSGFHEMRKGPEQIDLVRSRTAGAVRGRSDHPEGLQVLQRPEKGRRSAG